MAEVYPFVDDKINRTIQRFEPLLRSLDHPSIDAAVFYLSTPIGVPGIGFTQVKRGIVFPMPSVSDRGYLNKLLGTLKM